MWYLASETYIHCYFRDKSVDNPRVFSTGLGGKARGSTNDGRKTKYAITWSKEGDSEAAARGHLTIFTLIHTRELSILVVTIPPAVFMWPFSSPQNPYRETIKAKHTWRADVLELALPFSAEEHQKYLSATGTVQLPPS